MPSSRQGNVNTESVDNYLKAILALGGPEERRVSSTALADRLGVAPASVTNMLQKLASSALPFVEYERHRGVLLSAEGKRRALEVLRHHRLIETFLYEVLDYPLEEVHEEAERLEHFISERFEERIAAKLGHPKFDPHGHCIPAMDGKMPAQTSEPLTDICDQGTFIVDSVSDEDAPLLKRLKAHGVTPGAQLQIKSRSSDEFVLHAASASKALHLSRDLAAAVRVRSAH
ncbi:metal-dependent transcriptional regulator [Acidicapsa acidisoli]|uniref:metal-dependent transcriptional regulator n=1 Tax=Acidicapsa acidisoli TaxID=1615681 RepID=UPI0021DFBA78|nr:metal-dependent transcriptional regulator [Acidicapsa acidisoli]